MVNHAFRRAICLRPAGAAAVHMEQGAALPDLGWRLNHRAGERPRWHRWGAQSAAPDGTPDRGLRAAAAADQDPLRARGGCCHRRRAEPPPDVSGPGRWPGRRGSADTCCWGAARGVGLRVRRKARAGAAELPAGGGGGTPRGPISSRPGRCTIRSQNPGLKQLSKTSLRDRTRRATTAPAADEYRYLLLHCEPLIGISTAAAAPATGRAARCRPSSPGIYQTACWSSFLREFKACRQRSVRTRAPPL